MKNVICGSIFAFCALALPSISHAQVDFGGLVVAEIPCTCSPFTLQWFAPLYIDIAPLTGALSAPDTPYLYPYYYSFPSTWVLGFFTPGVQACWMWVWATPPFCLPATALGMPELGDITPFTGTSL